MHRVRLMHVGGDLTDHSLLSAGQIEPERVDQLLCEGARGGVIDPDLCLLAKSLLANQLQLNREELVEYQPATGLGDLGHRFGLVDRKGRVVAADEALCALDRLWQWVGERAGLGAPQCLGCPACNISALDLGLL